MGEKKSRHSYGMGLDTVYTLVTRILSLSLEELNCCSLTLPFCGALAAALNHHEEIKHVTEVGIRSTIALNPSSGVLYLY